VRQIRQIQVGGKKWGIVATNGGKIYWISAH
jgi:hypothetical protein